MTDYKGLEAKYNEFDKKLNDMQTQLTVLNKQLGKLMNRVEKLEAKLTVNWLTLNSVYGTQCPIKSVKHKEKHPTEYDYMKKALSTLSEFCSAHHCYTCPLQGDEPIASKCKLVSNAPCTYNRIELKKAEND